MIATLSTYIASEYPPLKIDVQPGSNIETRPARISRMKCVNGTVELDNQGTIAGDRDLNIVTQLTKSQSDQLNEMIDNHTDFLLAVNEGIFRGMIERSGEGGLITLKFWVLEKLNA